MNIQTPDSSQRRAARIAGIGYLVIIACGIFAEFVIRSSLIDTGNARETAENIAGAQSLFRLSIASDLVMLTFDVIVAMALFTMLRPVGTGAVVLATSLRLIHTAVYGVTLLMLFFVVQLSTDAAYLSAFDADQLGALTLLFAEAHSFGYVLGLVFFGLHLGVLAYLVTKSGYVTRIMGVLLGVAAIGYLVDSFANVLLTNYSEYETIFALVVFLPAFVAELSLALWLLIRGIGPRPEPAPQGAPEPASS